MVRKDKAPVSNMNPVFSDMSSSSSSDEELRHPPPSKRQKTDRANQQVNGLNENISPSPSPPTGPVNDDDFEKNTRHHLLGQRKSMGSPSTPATPAPSSARRLSLRQTYEGVIPRNGLNSSILADNNNKHISEKQLREIYQTSIELFSSHKITPQNAFSIKLIECLQDIIKLDSFDKTNMHEFGRTLEIGGKIYVCRVDSTHHQVMNLALELNAGKKSKKTGQDEDGEETETHENGLAEDMEEERKQKQRKKKSRAKNRHFKSEESLEMEYNFARRVQDRRETMEGLFEKWIENDEDFDYDLVLYRHHPKPEEEVRKCDEVVAAQTMVNFPMHTVNPDVLSIIIFFPFYFHRPGVWDKKAFDVWGRLLPNYDPAQFNLLQRPGSKNHNFEYIAQSQGASEEPDSPRCDDGPGLDLEMDNDDMCMNGGYPGGGSILDECGQVKPVDISKLNSLDQLSEYFLALKKLHLHKKDAYGWAGPNFTRNKRPVMFGNETGKPKKSRAKKDPEIIDFLAIDWKDKNNRYQLVAPEKTQLDQATIDEWIYAKTSIPYVGLLEPDFDDDEAEFDEPFEPLDEKDENYVDPLLRYFVDQNRNLLQLFSSGRHQADINYADDHNWSCNDDDAPEEMPDIEGGREFGDDFVDVNKDTDPDSRSRSMHLFSDALKSFAYCFPNPIPGMPNPFEDPLSEAYNLDTLKFAKVPKPINMHHLKKVILQILTTRLNLDVSGAPISPEETSLDMVEFYELLFDMVDDRTRHFLSLSIATVALLHIVVDKKLFMESDTVPGSNGRIICRGANWVHKDHIPSQLSLVDSDQGLLECPQTARVSTIYEAMENSIE